VKEMVWQLRTGQHHLKFWRELRYFRGLPVIYRHGPVVLFLISWCNF
jgi:hypothetical protein